MANLIYDKALSFGTMSTLSGSFPNDINLGRPDGSGDHYPGKDFTGAGRLTVDVCFTEPSGGAGASVSITVLGSPDGLTGWAPVGMLSGVSLAQMQAGVCQVAISPKADTRMLRATLLGSGVTGSAEAFLNTYAGK